MWKKSNFHPHEILPTSASTSPSQFNSGTYKFTQNKKSKAKLKMNSITFILLCAFTLILPASTYGDNKRESNIAAYRRRVRCRLPFYPHCYMVSRLCPHTCPYSCLMDCTLCRPVCRCNMPGAVCQDPRFVGGDGLTFYFHGHKDSDFCLVTDKNLHISARFIGKRNANMKRDFTWVQSLGILFDSHKLYVGAKKTALWDDKVDRIELAFDDQFISLPLVEGARWNSTEVAITRNRAANGVTLEADGKFEITVLVVPITKEESRVHKYEIRDDDCFAHLDIGFKFYGLSEEVNGVLGQTYSAAYSSKVNIGAAMSVLGGEDKFSSSHIFATDCTVSRFGGEIYVSKGGD